MGIFLSRGQALVAQKFLDDSQVRATAQKMRSEGMAEGMRAYFSL
jgi:hypothetical protein